IEYLRNELEEVKKEKESIDFKIENFGNASNDLDKLLGSQKLNKDKKGVGFDEYYAVPPPPAQVYSPPKKDLSWMGLPEFVDDTVTDYTRPTPSVDVSKGVSSELEGNNSSVFKQGGSSGNVVSNPMIKFVKETSCPSVPKIINTENSRKPTMKYAEIYRNSKSPRVRGNQRNWNNKKSQQLGKDFLMQNKACYKCGCFDHLASNCVKNQVWVPKVPTVRTKILGSKVLTGRPIVAADLINKRKAVKASARWIWKPKQNSLNQGSNLNGVSVTFKKYNYIDTQGRPKSVMAWDSGCSRHMTGNISYLSDYEPYDGGYVPFSHGGGKITGKGTIKTGKLEFENVYFMKELKYNLFSVSQICDNKNSVLFTDSECLVLGKHFKLVDDTHVLLRTPRQQNMYSIDLKDIVPHKNLTCLIAKAFVDEGMLWHRRCDNGGEFRNREMDEFCSKKGIKKEFSNARTPQQNGVAERRNRTLIEARRTISPAIGFLRPFGCHVMILNTLDRLGKFDAKGDEGYFVGYSLKSKAFRVFNKRTKKVEENLHVDFLENKPIKKGAGPNWLFDIDTLTNLMNYVPVVVAGTSSTNISGTKEYDNQAVKKNVSSLRFIALPNWFDGAHMETSNDSIRNSDAKDDSQKVQDSYADVSESSRNTNPTATSKYPTSDQVEHVLSSTVETEVPTISSPDLTDCLSISPVSSSGPRIISRGGSSYQEAPSLGNAMSFENRIHKDHPKSQIIGPVDTPVQTRHKTKNMEEQSFIAIIHQKTNPDLLQYCLFSCFLSQEEPKKIFDALKYSSWVDAMQEELL
ncbi:putative ribonuclease H-like domain-containing protein, partial [Tanacetum coccineum]